jgi:hypothetical protein
VDFHEATHKRKADAEPSFGKPNLAVRLQLKNIMKKCKENNSKNQTSQKNRKLQVEKEQD